MQCKEPGATKHSPYVESSETLRQGSGDPQGSDPSIRRLRMLQAAVSFVGLNMALRVLVSGLLDPWFRAQDSNGLGFRDSGSGFERFRDSGLGLIGFRVSGL